MKPSSRRLAVPVVMAIATFPLLAAGNANFLLGGRQLDEDQWDPVEEQGAFGVTVDFGGVEWPVHVEVGFYGSGADEELFDDSLLMDVDVTGGVAELCAGVNKTWMPGESIR